VSASDVHRRYVQCFNDRDWDTMASLVHPDFVYTGPDGNPVPGGPPVALAVNQGFASAYGPAHIEVTSVYEAGDVSVMEFWGIGTHSGEIFGVPASGGGIRAAVCDVIEVRDGKIYREREYFDVMTLMQQMGAVPQTAAANA
jgi:steroid delta-isomerase-like uncharacterized protein